MEKFIIVSANFCQSVFEKGFLQDVRHNLWRILRRDLVPVPSKRILKNWGVKYWSMTPKFLQYVKEYS